MHSVAYLSIHSHELENVSRACRFSGSSRHRPAPSEETDLHQAKINIYALQAAQNEDLRFVFGNLAPYGLVSSKGTDQIPLELALDEYGQRSWQDSTERTRVTSQIGRLFRKETSMPPFYQFTNKWNLVTSKRHHRSSDWTAIGYKATNENNTWATLSLRCVPHSLPTGFDKYLNLSALLYLLMTWLMISDKTQPDNSWARGWV